MKIAYIGHPSHEWTKSDHFFLEKLELLHSVDVFRPTKSDFSAMFQDLASLSYDCLVFWQHDFLAYSLSALGRPCLIVPMLDGSGAKSFQHWSMLSQCHFISFSHHLSAYLKLRNISSTHSSFAPEEKSEWIRFRDKNNQAFAWIRDDRPSFSLAEMQEIGEIIGLDKILVRSENAEQIEKCNNFDLLKPISISERSKHLQILNESRFFFAPRRIEGIGMSFLEAMSLGSIVIARNRPTASQYIAHGMNGFLVGTKKIYPSTFSSQTTLDQMSTNSRTTVFDRNSNQSLQKVISEGLSKAVSMKKSKPKNIGQINDLIELSIRGFEDNGPGLQTLPKLSWLIRS